MSLSKGPMTKSGIENHGGGEPQEQTTPIQDATGGDGKPEWSATADRLLAQIGEPNTAAWPERVREMTRFYIRMVVDFHAQRLVRAEGHDHGDRQTYPIAAFDVMDAIAREIAARHLWERLGVVIVPIDLRLGAPKVGS
jgi:hypothetical protein